MRKTAIILSYERPIYLWNTLDALYKATRSDVDFILVDQGSTDPLVSEVIDGFVARGLIATVIRNAHNDPFAMERLLSERYSQLSDVFFYIENDVVVDRQPRCWTDRMLDFFDFDPQLAMLGSLVDTSDFVPREHLEAKLGREATKPELDAIKWFSPERAIPPIGPDEIASPFNPPGRLLALRKAAIKDVPVLRDAPMHDHLLANGWRTGITGAVVHRHLSLFNFFDFPHYGMAKRDDFMNYASGEQ